MSLKLSGKERQIYVMDYEVLSRLRVPESGQSYWCVVFKNYFTNEWKIIKNDVEALRTFYKQTRDDIFVTYNGRHYDQYIHKGILLGMDAGYINDKIILDKAKGYHVVRDGKKVPFLHYDVAMLGKSLKQLEGFMGHDIEESSVSFNIDRPMTIEEEKELIKYCIHDVDETSEVLKVNWNTFTSFIGLIEMFNLDINMINNTETQLSAVILDAQKANTPDDEFEFVYPDTLDINIYSQVKEFFDDVKKKKSSKNELGKPVNLVTTIGGVECVYALGGVHGAVPNYVGEGLIVSADVNSLYPSIIIEYLLMARSVLSPEKYNDIVEKRLAYKAVKNPLQASLKLVINKTFGGMGDKFNALYDMRNMRSVCVTGQLLITDLIEKIQDHCELLNINTDGVFFKVKDEETLKKIEEIAHEWEKRTRLGLGWERYSKIIQKDVNNYIVLPEGDLFDEKGKPQWKGKGSYLKKLNDLDYDLPIVNKAVVNYFTQEIPIEKTIIECNDLREFQKIVKLGSGYINTRKNVTFKSVKEINPATGRMRTVEKVDDYGIVLPDKTHRVFASSREEDGGIFKEKPNKNPEKFANTPDKCFFDNSHVLGKEVPVYLDRQYYIDMSQDRIYQILGLDSNGNTEEEAKRIKEEEKERKRLEKEKEKEEKRKLKELEKAEKARLKALEPKKKKSSKKKEVISVTFDGSSTKEEVESILTKEIEVFESELGSKDEPVDIVDWLFS